MFREEQRRERSTLVCTKEGRLGCAVRGDGVAGGDVTWSFCPALQCPALRDLAEMYREKKQMQNLPSPSILDNLGSAV